MADTFTCTENPEHVNSLYSGQEGAPDRGQSWFECDVHPGRVRVGYYEAPTCAVPGCVCGHPPEDHPTTAQRYTNQVGWHPPTFNADGTVATEPYYEYAVHSHSYSGDGGPCQEQVGMHKLVGFLCIDCGAPLEGMPTKG
jgi:hypothetical protein